MKQGDVRLTPSFRWSQENPELYKKTLEFQSMLREQGIAWHNPFADECTQDFACCVPSIATPPPTVTVNNKGVAVFTLKSQTLLPPVKDIQSKQSGKKFPPLNFVVYEDDCYYNFKEMTRYNKVVQRQLLKSDGYILIYKDATTESKEA
jgi:hypothetical protein